MEIVSSVFILIGAANFVICGAGMLTFRDVYARMSVLSTASGFGVSMIIIGVFLLEPRWSTAIVGIGAIILLLGTSAIGSILISRSSILRHVAIVDVQFNEANVWEGEFVSPDDFQYKQETGQVRKRD
ncbi:sodium:proton antiporter [Corynebacterium pseudodiphtheriticum]|nr:sodium:proton antiporter [Corynebacterium pseudodiphtheriticum]RUP96846.1 sodium:proton antiporter [Corynebacterium pseudodiphtheriticum]RUQ00176.1 sodium:proton antiporter [Corynebacterium pseudodiphtheriticum]RUQ48010.1 sodium:proton antiporter [Corynebacterium pseudodiphtheriticum]